MHILRKEYPVSAKSPRIVWDMIGSAAGMQKWMADRVTEDGDHWTFSWGEPWTERDTKVAEVVERVKPCYIRLKWDSQQTDPQAYWELRIEQSELTGHIHLIVTDYAEDEDIDNLNDLWDKNMEHLHRASGL